MDEYILDHRTPIPCPEHIDWGFWVETTDRCVDQSRWISRGQTVDVCTLFLGLGHYTSTGQLMLFETMVFVDGESDGTVMRYSTWDKALLGHQMIVTAQKTDYPVDYQVATAQLRQQRWLRILMQRCRLLHRRLDPRQQPEWLAASQDMMWVDLMLQLNNGVPVSELLCRVTDDDVDHYLQATTAT